MDEGSNGVIGKGICIRGNLSGREELVIEGEFEGRISLDSHLIIKSTAVVNADIEAVVLTVAGIMNGGVVASDQVGILAGASVTGDIKAPRVMIEDGASFNGHIDMETSESLKQS